MSKGAQRSLWLNNPIAIYVLNYCFLFCLIVAIYSITSRKHHILCALLSILCAPFSVQVCCASSLGIAELRQKLWPPECRRNFAVPRISKRKFTPQFANTLHVVHCISIHLVPASCPQFFRGPEGKCPEFAPLLGYSRGAM
jgi:hypothetical protein